MRPFSVFLGALRYEFRMQIRRPALWITLILIACFEIGLYSRLPGISDILTHLSNYPLLTVVVSWTHYVNMLLPEGIGVMLADRFVRDRRTQVDELFTALPGALSARLTGKFLGSTLATLVPVLTFYTVGVIYIVYQTHELLAVPLALETFAVIVLPGIVFVSGFSLACPAVLWVPLYQFLFIGYWMWGTVLSPYNAARIPTLNGTLISPTGDYMSLGFFGVDFHQLAGATSMQAVESVLVLVGLGVLMMVVLWGYVRWREG